MDTNPMNLDDDEDKREDRLSTLHHLYLLGLFLICIGLSGMCSSPRPAHGQDARVRPELADTLPPTTPAPCCDDARPDELRRALLRLADSVSRVCAHESSFVSLADCLLVWQATRHHGDTPEARNAWLHLHSPCALRGMRCGRSGGRHRGDPGHWSSTLPTSGNEQPENWPSTLVWSTYAPRWAAIRRTMRRLVVRGEPPAHGWPCPEDPDSWAGRVYDAEHVRRHAAHLRALGCHDPVTGEPTRNEGYRWT